MSERKILLIELSWMNSTGVLLCHREDSTIAGTIDLFTLFVSPFFILIPPTVTWQNLQVFPVVSFSCDKNYVTTGTNRNFCDGVNLPAKNRCEVNHNPDHEWNLKFSTVFILPFPTDFSSLPLPDSKEEVREEGGRRLMRWLLYARRLG